MFIFLGVLIFTFALSLRFLTKLARVLQRILGSLFFSTFFASLAYALSGIFEKGLKFIIGVITLLVITILLVIEFLLGLLEKLIKSQSLSSESKRLESDGIQLKAAALYNSFEYVSQLDSAKADKNLCREFWDELTNYRNSGMFSRDQQKTILGNADVEGKFINVLSGLRVTPNQPADSVGKVHLFGGSTIFAYEVTDEHTPSAFLQRQFNKLDIRYSVVNHGVGGSTIGDCLRRIKLLNLSKSDIVIVLFGDNDIGINAPKKIVGRGIFRAIPFWGKLLFVLKRYSRMLNWLFLETVEYKYTDLETNASLLGKTISYYFQIGEYLKSLKIPVCFLLQPNLYTKVVTNEDETRLKLTYPKHWEKTVVSGYQILRDSLESDAFFWDISDLFDDKSGAYFLDWAHVNSIGNEIISSAMFNVLKERELI